MHPRYTVLVFQIYVVYDSREVLKLENIDIVNLLL